MKTHKIFKTNNKEKWLKEIKSYDLNNKNWIVLDILPWGGEYKPLTLATLSYDDYGFNVYMRSYDKNIRFKGQKRNDPVHLDSCLEFFFSPVNGNAAYFNFEINPLGTLYTGYSPTGLRKDSGPVMADLPFDYFDIKAMTLSEAENYDKDFWDVSYTIPYDYIKKFFPDFVMPEKIKANFYKCGDLTEHEHYIVWNNIDIPSPDYHRPDYFGTLEL